METGLDIFWGWVTSAPSTALADLVPACRSSPARRGGYLCTWQFIGTGILSRHLRRGGLADQDAQCTSDGIDLDAAYGQASIEDAPHQAGGLAALMTCDTARATLRGLWGTLRHKARLRGDNAHYGSFFRQGKGNSIEISNTWLTIVNPKFGLPLCINNLKPATFFRARFPAAAFLGARSKE